MKKFSLTHKLLAVALAFVLVAVSLPDYLSFAQQPAQEQSETDEFEDNLADGDPSDDDLSGDNPSDTGEQEMEQQVVLHLQAPETVPMGTAGSFGLSAQNTAATAAAVSIQLTQEEMAAYQAAEQDSTLALQPVGDSLTFTLQPGEQVEGTLSFLYPNGYSSREVVEIAEEDISIVLQQLPEEETGGTPIETIPPEGEIQPPPADETQQPGGEGPTDPSDGEETPPLESGDGEDPTDPSDGGETTPPESGDGEEATDPSDGEDETLPPESGDGEEATDSSNEEETTPPDDETDPSVGEGGVMPSDEQEQVLQTVEQSTVSLAQDYQTGPDGELSEEPTTDSEPADESGTTENEGSTEPSGSESGNPTDLENTGSTNPDGTTGSTNPDNTGTGDNSLSGTEDGDQQGNDPTGSQDDDQQDGGPTGSQGDGQQGNDPTGSQGDGQQSDDLTGSQDDVQQDNDPTGSQDESGQEQPQVSFDIAGATLTFTASFGWGELTLTAQPLETEQQEAASPETAQPDLSYTIEAASQNRETTGTIYTRSWSLQQVIALPQGASFVEGEAVVDGNQIRISATPVLSVDDQSGTAGELSAQRDGETLLVTYTKTLSDWQSLEAESISDLGLAMTLHQEAVVRDESFTEGQVDVSATFTATPVTAAAEIAPAAVLAVLDTGGDEQQDGSQSVTQQGSLSLPLSGEQQPEQPQSGGADIAVTYTGEAVYTEQDALAVRYTIEVTNGNEPQEPSGGDEGEGQPEGSNGAVTVKIVQNLNEWFSGIATQEPNEPTGDWDESAKTLTWGNVEIEAGKNWTRTVTVLIDTDKITGLDVLPTALTSSVLVYDATAGEPGDKPIAQGTAEKINLQEFVGSEIRAGENITLPDQNVYWRDNNDIESRPDPTKYVQNAVLQFYIGEGTPGEEDWITLTTETMGRLGLTEETLPKVTTSSAKENASWQLTAQVPGKIQYGGGEEGVLKAKIQWRILPSEANNVPKLPAYYLYQPDNDEGWYYLKKQEVTFNIDFRDAVYDEKITAEEVKQLIEKHFVLYTQPGADPDTEVKWNEIDWEVKGSNGDYTLTITNAVYYTINNEVVHYYLLANNETEGTIPINEDWPGSGQGDSYKIEYDNHNNPNVGTVTDKVYSGGTLVLTREGTVEYKATKEWITPENREGNRPDGYFELYRYTYPGGSYQTAAPVHGVETVPFADVGNDGKVVFKSTDGSELELPKYDPEGNRYVYVMKEVLTDTGEDKDSYEQIFGKVDSDGEVKADSDQGPPEDVREGNWERESNDNFVYNGGTITNRIDEQKTVSVTKEWDASSFQAGLGNVEVEMTLYERVKGSTDKWVKSNPEKIIKMDEFSAVNASMSGSTTVPTYNALGQEMEYRFVETGISYKGQKVELTEGIDEDGNPIRTFKLTNEAGNTVAFISKEEVSTDGTRKVVNSIQDEITYTIDKIWVEPLQGTTVSFALYQQGQGQTNTYVGTVTLDGIADETDEKGNWENAQGGDEKKATLTVGEKTYDVIYKVTKDNFEELVIEGLPRYDEHGYSYEYVILETPDTNYVADYETTIDESGNYTTIVTNAPGEGHRILVRKRWIDNSDVQHREPVTITAYYADDNNFENDKALGSVTLGAPSVGTGQTGAWYDYISLDWQKVVGEVKDFDLNKVYIRETAIGDQTDVDTDEDSNLEIPGNRERVDNKITDRIDGEHHTYEVTYSIATLSPGQDGDGGDAGNAAGTQTFYVATNRRLGNIDMTVTKEWKDGGALREALQKADIVPVVKLVVDTGRTSAEPPGEDQKIEDIINYDTNEITLTNDKVPILNNEDKQATAIQRLLDENGKPVETLYFFNLPKYDKDGRVANYTVEELWTTQDNITNDKIIDPTKCVGEDDILKEIKDPDLEELLAELFEDLTVTVTQESYTENDGNHTNDTQKIAITNKLSGTKSIEFHKQWNDTYAFDSGKRPDLYLTLYQLTGDNLITEYREYHWDKSLQTEEGEGGQQGQGEETEEPPQEGGTETQAQDNYYWTCIFENLPKYDEDGNEIFYYAVENLAVEDPSTFHYAKPEFQYNNQEVEVKYGEDETVTLPGDGENVDDQTGQKILREVEDKVALLENGTFLNNLEEDVTINGVKLWANLPLTASEADLPSVTFNVYQHSSDENGAPGGNGTLVAKLEVTSEMWKNPPQDGSIKPSGNQYTFTIDKVTEESVAGPQKDDPLPLYDEDGRRYTYTLEEVLGTADDDPNVDWTLVYHNDTFNEYQITNTYDPQLGALSVKKLLQVDAQWPSGQYPAITMFLERGVMENGNWVKDDTYQGETIVWTSTQVEEAAKKAVESNPSEQTVVLSSRGTDGESIFLFKNLEMYAPNGEAYYYRVVEQLDNMHYEAAVVSEDDSSTNGVGKDLGNVSDINDVFGDKGYQAEEGKAELATKPLRPIENEDWSNGSDGSEESDGNVNPEALTPRATFGDRYPEDETITLKVTKEWIDNNDALKLRPDVDQFAKSLKVYRKADGQGGTGGAGAISEEEITEKVTITPDEVSQDDNHYTYTIKGKDVEGLEKIAPNGMPWIYVVKEKLTGKAVSYLPVGKTSLEKSADEAEPSDGETVLDLGELKNTLTTSQSFKKQWQNGEGGSITEDYLGLGDITITITGQLWVGEKDADGNVSNMQKASEYFTSENGWIGPDKWWDEKPDFTVDLITQLGDNDQTETISNLPRVAVENGDTKELVYAIVETGIKVTNPDYTQTFTWEWENEKLTVTSQDPLNGLFTPQEITVGGSTTIINNRLQTTDLSVEKLWVGDENETNLRPSPIAVVVQRKVQQEGGDQSEQADELTRATLMAPRTTEDGWENVPNGNNGYLTVKLEEATGWKASIPNLPTYGIQDNGLVTYDYRIHELKPGWKDDGNLSDDEILDADEKYNGHYTVSAYSEDGLTVTNTLTHMDITAVKKWKPGTLTGENAKVIFTLQSRVGNGEWTDVDGQQTIELDGTPDQDGEFEAWKARWTELPRTDSSGAAIEYRVQETLATGLDDEHVTIIYPKDTITGSTADKTYTVTNIPLGQITVTKEGGDGNGLAGVEFTLNSDSSTPMPLVGKTGEDGKLTFMELPLYDEQTGEPITYTLTESATPDGHIRLEQPIEVSFTAQEKPVDGIYWQTTDGFLLHEVEYEVVNGQYFPVVHTGGSGFYWPGVLGAGAAAAGVLYLIRRKTKGHNTER